MTDTLTHVDYPHQGNGDLYDCPACEVIMAESPAVVVYQTDVKWESEYDDEPVNVGSDEEEYDCTPDDYDDEHVTAVDNAVKIIGVYAVEPSSSPGFHAGIWYSDVDGYTHPYTGVIENRTFHLRGFTEDQEREIHDRLTSRR